MFEIPEGTGLRRWLMQMMPFVCLTAEGTYKVSHSKVVESLIVGITAGLIAGAFAGYISLVQMEVKMDVQKEKLVDIQRKIDCLDQRIFDMGVKSERARADRERQ